MDQAQIHPALLVKTNGDGKEENPATKYNTRFKQQTLKHVRLNISAAGFASVAIVIGLLFIPTGIVLFYASNQAQEVVIDYTHCSKRISTNCLNSLVATKSVNCCSIDFTLHADFKGKVYIYYGLTKFYQNHRLFAKSKDDRQLYGSTGKLMKECRPYESVMVKNSTKYYWPCGALANGMFQDRIRIYFYGVNGTGGEEIQIQRTGIAWKTDIAYKFRNPPGWNTSGFQKRYAAPPSWRILPWELANGLQNEDFIIWMRIAALPEFRKVYGIVTKDGLSKGKYRLDVEDEFEVKSFKGTKSIIIATKSIMGGRNTTLGILYVALGISFVVTGLFFLYVYLNTL